MSATGDVPSPDPSSRDNRSQGHLEPEVERELNERNERRDWGLPPTWFKHHADYVPDDCDGIPLYGMRLVVMMNSDGLPTYITVIDNGEHADIFQMCGFLDAMKIEALKKHIAEAIEVS